MGVSLSTRWLRAERVETVRPGLQLVVLEDGSEAYNLSQLTGEAEVGRLLLVNTTAVELGLGSGGRHVVVAQARIGQRQSPAGHLMKLRYAPHQMKVTGPEEPGGPPHDRLKAVTAVDGMPVVCLALHSQLGPAAAALACCRPGTRAVYVMTDEAALPAVLSDLAWGLRQAGLLLAVITAGQAFGGDVEAVNLYSALLVARHHLQAEVVFVGIGPGNLGTGTPFGHGGVAQGQAVNAAAALAARPIAVLRVSSADPRIRHRGVSHHTKIALGRVALAAATIPLPPWRTEEVAAAVAALPTETGMDRHVFVHVPSVDWRPLLAAAGLASESMGRGPEEDPDFFEAAASGGVLAAAWLGQEDRN